MIPHKYTNASDNLAQYVADHELPGKNNTRQEVTADWYMEHMGDVWRLLSRWREEIVADAVVCVMRGDGAEIRKCQYCGAWDFDTNDDAEPLRHVPTCLTLPVTT